MATLVCRSELSGDRQLAKPSQRVAARNPARAGKARPARAARPRTLGLNTVEPVYGTVIALVRTVWRVQGLRFTVIGQENIPATGGAVIAINHTGYMDFTLAGLPTFREHRARKVRFMAKQEVFDSKITGPIMRGCRHIPVDRSSGAASYEAAVERLKAGELDRCLSRSDHQPQLRDQGIQIRRCPDGDRGRCADHSAHRLGRPADLDQGPSQEDVPPQGADRDTGRRADPADSARARADRVAALPDAASAGAGPRCVRFASARRVVGPPPPRWQRPDSGRGRRARCRRSQSARSREGRPRRRAGPNNRHGARLPHGCDHG